MVIGSHALPANGSGSDFAIPLHRAKKVAGDDATLPQLLEGAPTFTAVYYRSSPARGVGYSALAGTRSRIVVFIISYTTAIPSAIARLRPSRHSMARRMLPHAHEMRRLRQGRQASETQRRIHGPSPPLHTAESQLAQCRRLDLSLTSARCLSHRNNTADARCQRQIW